MTEAWKSGEINRYVTDSNRDIVADELADPERAATLLRNTKANLTRGSSNGYLDIAIATVFEAGNTTNPLDFYKKTSIPKLNGYDNLVDGIDMGNAIALAGVNENGDVQILTPNYGENALEINEGYEYYLKLSAFKSLQTEIVFKPNLAQMTNAGIESHIDAHGDNAYNLLEYDQIRVEFFIPESTYTLDPYEFLLMIETTEPSVGRSYIFVTPTTVEIANKENKGFYTAYYNFNNMEYMRKPDLASAVEVSLQFGGWLNGVNRQTSDDYDIYVKSIKLYGATSYDIPSGSSYCTHMTGEGESALEYTVIPATCLKAGYSAYKCNLCGYEKIDNDYSKITHPKGHDFVLVSSKNPTCTESGYSYSECSRCDVTDYAEIASLGHRYRVEITPDGTMLVACLEGDVITMPPMTSNVPTYSELLATINDDGNVIYGNLATTVFPSGYTLINTSYSDVGAESSKRYGDIKPTVRNGSFSILQNDGSYNVDSYMRLKSDNVYIQNYINAFLQNSGISMDPGTDVTIEFSVRNEIRTYEPETYNKKTFEIIDRSSGTAVFMTLCEISPLGVLTFGENNLEFQLSDERFTNIALSIHPASGTYDVYIDGILLGVDFNLPQNKHPDLKNLTTSEFRFNQYATDSWTDLANLVAYDAVCPKFIKGFQDVQTDGDEFVPEGYDSLEFDIKHNTTETIDEDWLKEFKSGVFATYPDATEETVNQSFFVETIEKDGEMVNVVTWKNFKSGLPRFNLTNFTNVDYKILTSEDSDKYPMYDLPEGESFKVYDISGYDSVTIELYCDTVSQELIDAGKEGYTFVIAFFSPSTSSVYNYYYTLYTVVPENIEHGEDGWQKITIPFSDLMISRRGDLSCVTHFAIAANGWGKQGVGNGTYGSYVNDDQNAVDGTVLKIKSIVLNDQGTVYFAPNDESCEHDYSLRVEVASTCLTNGYIAQKCTKCGGEKPYMQSITPLSGHTMETVIDFPRTCNSTNAKIDKCAVCNARVLSRYIVLGHEYTTNVYAPTCESEGYTTYGCYCGKTFEKYDIVDALGHEYGDWVITTEPSYSYEGERRRICAHDESHYISETIDILINEKVPEIKYDENGNIIGSDVWFGEADVIIKDDDQVNIGMGTNGEEKPLSNSAKLVKELIKALVDKDLSLKHDYGEIIFDEKAMKKLAKHAGDVEMIVKIITTDEEASEGKCVYSFSVNSDGVELLPESSADENGTMSVTLMFQTGLDQKDVRVTYRAPDGQMYDVNVKNYNPETGEVTFDTDHFSEYEISVVQSDGTEITKASITMGSDLTLNLYATLSEARKDAQIRFTLNNNTVTVDGIFVSNELGYKFAFKGINPQCMGDVVTIELIHDGHVIETLNYSIRAYCDVVLALGAEALEMSEEKYNALTALISDLLEYGAESQIYRGYKLNALVNEGITGASEFVHLDYTDMKLVDKDEKNGVSFQSATLRFDNANQLYFLFTAPDVSKISVMLVTGTYSKMYTAEDFIEYSDDTYMFGSDDLMATDYEDVYTVVLMHNGKIIQNLTYSVRSYVYSMQNTSNEDGSLSNMARLSRALWCYGQSAKAYAAIN